MSTDRKKGWDMMNFQENSVCFFIWILNSHKYELVPVIDVIRGVLLKWCQQTRSDETILNFHFFVVVVVFYLLEIRLLLLSRISASSISPIVSFSHVNILGTLSGERMKNCRYFFICSKYKYSWLQTKTETQRYLWEFFPYLYYYCHIVTI